MTTTATGAQTRYQLDDLQVDTAQRRVTRAGVAIELSALTFDLFKVLVEAAPSVVSYDDLAEKAWRRHFVSPESITQRVMLLRQSLADDASEPRYIEAVRGKGYRLIPSVQALPSIQPAPAADAVQPPRWPMIAASAAALVVVLIVVTVGVYRFHAWPTPQTGTARAPLPNSVAILPLKNLSPNAEHAYFAAGIHQEIIGRLAKVRDLGVIARTSVQQYADTGKSIPEIAMELNVETVLEGSVRYAGERVRITVNLIDATTGASRWSEVYDQQLGDVFAVQEDIATRIATALGADFFPPGANDSHQATTSPEAAALYLRVLDLQRQTSYDDAVQHQYLDRALAFDPNFANAYALKAVLYAISVVDRADGRALDTESAILERLALENAAKALELDPKSAQAYLATAAVHRFFWRWSDALEAFEKAYELSPNDVDTLDDYAESLSWAGDHERAIRLMERAVQLDPDSPGMRWDLGVVLGQAGQPAAAVVVLREAAKMAPAVVPIRHWLAQMEAVSGNQAAALAELRTVERLGGPWNPALTAGLLYSYARIGQSEDVARLFTELQRLAADGPVGAGTWALTYLALGDADQAHRWLALAVEKIENHEADAGYLNLMTIKSNPQANAVLDETRFRELRDRIGALEP